MESERTVTGAGGSNPPLSSNFSKGNVRHDFHPPAYVPSEIEHVAAYRLECLQYICWDSLLGINMARSGDWNSVFSDPKKHAEDRLAELLADLFTNDPAKKKLECWERLVDFDKFKAGMIEDLASEHCGDCTAVACACARCHAEDKYGLPNTVTWGKYEAGAIKAEQGNK